MTTSLLTRRIRAANDAGRKALIPFLPAGFPTPERFWKEITALDAHGADVIEIGVPFSDPVADGPVVEAASLQCLEGGACLGWILEGLRERRASLRAGVVLMGYMNPFYQYGLEAFAKDAAAAGANGVIVPDLPLEEAGPFRTALSAQGMDLIPLVGLNTSVERMRAYAATASGFVYLVSVMGVTGARATLPPEIARKLADARDAFDIPLALGFGIREPKQLEPFAPYLDAVVFGSALIQHIQQEGDAAGFMARWTD